MGWFDEQIEDRKKQERRMLTDSYEKLQLTVTGRKSGESFLEGEDDTGKREGPGGQAGLPAVLIGHHVPEGHPGRGLA